MTEVNLHRVGLAALDQALARYMQAWRDRNSDVANAATTEAVWWICLLDEGLDPDMSVRRSRKRRPPITDYERRRDADPAGNGQSIWALRAVRNLMTHQAVVTTTRETTPFRQPRGFWISRSQFLWVPEDSIRDWGVASPQERQEYSRRLAKRPVPGALNQAHTWLTEETGRLTR